LVQDLIFVNKYSPRDILITESCSKSAPGKRFLQLVNGLPINIVEDRIMNDIADTVNTQGVIALFDIPSISFRDYVCGHANASSFYVLCDAIADPGNCGTLIRSAAGLGADGVVPVGGCDPWVNAICSI
jgi:tRNA G18 (ribose-2'-O)-methylase SpoU